MGYKYVCSDCGREYDSSDFMYLCPECEKENDGSSFIKGVLRIELDDAALEKAKKRGKAVKEDFYPISVSHSDEYKIGPTPLVRNKRLSGLENAFFKLDSLLPSGSFKDRASYLVGEEALLRGERKIVLASTGNAGAAMSAVGASLSLDIVLFVPKTAPVNKLMQSILYKAHVIPVAGTYDDAFALSIEYTKRHGGINRNTAYNPMTIEGKKSISIELFEQMGRKVPDAIYVPVGDGCIIGGVAKGFDDLRKAGLIEKVPRLIACQSDASAAISNAIENDDFSTIEASTRADSISVDLPANGRAAVRAVKASGGWAVRVSDKEILTSQLVLTRESGVLAEPAAAAAFAALEKDRDHLVSVLGKEASITVLLTGTGFKDMKAFDGAVSLPESIENSVEAVKALPF